MEYINIKLGLLAIKTLTSNLLHAVSELKNSLTTKIVKKCKKLKK